MTQRIGIADAKRHFADVLGEVRYRGERFIIERRGTPIAALVPLEDLDDDGGTPEQGALALVGAFADAPFFADVLDGIVSSRPQQTSRPVPPLA
jgi:prevent-host-death family protein